MASTYTPLRYPGGKTIMADILKEIFNYNNISNPVLAEPYAGGAGASIKLLLTNQVDKIIINDASLPIYAFWQNLISNGEKLIDLIDKTPVNLDIWKYCHRILKETKTPSIELAFAVFFLSRTNRSGILNAGPIGGNTQEKQDRASYKIDCRFNKTKLICQLRDIVNHSESISVFNLDAIQFLETLEQDVFVYLDPPYFQKGRSLYLDYYLPEDHKILANYLKQSSCFQWLLSYDNAPQIRDLYTDYNLYLFNLSYSAHTKRKGEELLTHSKGILLDEWMSTKNLGLSKIQHEN